MLSASISTRVDLHRKNAYHTIPYKKIVIIQFHAHFRSNWLIFFSLFCWQKKTYHTISILWKRYDFFFQPQIEYSAQKDIFRKKISTCKIYLTLILTLTLTLTHAVPCKGSIEKMFIIVFPFMKFVWKAFFPWFFFRKTLEKNFL